MIYSENLWKLNMFKISIIIPTFNRKEFLSEAIKSALEQDYPNIEIIVSDNASTDGTNLFMKRFENEARILYHRQSSNIGMVNNWKNAIFDIASGDWFLILSDDDYFIDKSFLSKAMTLITQNAFLSLVYAGGYLLDTISKKKEALKLPLSGVVNGKKIFIAHNTVQPRDFILCSVIFNRQLTIQLNAFSNPHSLCCDSELFLLSCLNGQVGIIDGFPTVYRCHTQNLSHSIIQDPDLIHGDLVTLVSIYQYAISKGFTKEALCFSENLAIETITKEKLLRILSYKNNVFFDCIKNLFKKSPELIKKISKDPIFLLKVLSLLLCPRYFFILLRQLKTWIKNLRVKKFLF